MENNQNLKHVPMIEAYCMTSKSRLVLLVKIDLSHYLYPGNV